MKVKCFFAFAGYNSQGLAMRRLQRDCPEFSFQTVGWSEIDKYAITAYKALFPEDADKNYGDVTAINWSEVPDFDILTWSSPCTNISTAGKQEGMDEDSGTASSFIWCIKDCLAVKKPKFILVENVANIVGKRFIGQFNKFQNLLESFGYVCHCSVMNAKDFGTPQNRKRLFLVARRADMPIYYFPKPFKLEKRLKDVLEQNVDERYYLSDKAVRHIFANSNFKPKINPRIAATIVCGHHSYKRTDNFIAEPRCIQIGQLYDENSNPQAGRIYSTEGVSPTLDCCQGGNREPKIAEPLMLGWTRNDKGEIIDLHSVNVANCVTAAKRDNTQNYVIEPCISSIRGRADGEWHSSEHQQRLEIGGSDTSNSLTSVAKDNLLIEPAIIEDFYGTVRDPRVYTDVAPTLRADRTGLMTTVGIRIRRLTERELFRLMDVDEPDIDTLLSAGIAKTQLAKLAGNSVVCACYYHILRNLFIDTNANENEQLQLF